MSSLYDEVQGLTLPLAALWVAKRNIGFGETTANNRGEFITALGGKPTGSNWCALLVSYCYQRAFYLRMYSRPDKERGTPFPFKKSAGAKAVVKNMAKVGSFFTNPKLAQPGDLIAWHRGLPGAWTGHVGMVESVDEDGLVHTVEGNVGKFPAKVKRLIHDVSRERLYGFATLRKGVR